MTKEQLTAFSISVAKRLLLALIVYWVGTWVIKKILQLLEKISKARGMDETLQKFLHNGLRITFYILLVISIVSILGVPMASVITVLASAGMAISLALQGSLSNLAGGIMLMLFRPFSVGDFIQVGDALGTVKELTIFYTVLTKPDNVRITIPNGKLMDADIMNFSVEETRRVDLRFKLSRESDIGEVKRLMAEAVSADARVLENPSGFMDLTDVEDDGLVFTTRVWVKGEDYWDVLFDLKREMTEAFRAAGLEAPVSRIAVSQE